MFKLLRQIMLTPLVSEAPQPAGPALHAQSLQLLHEQMLARLGRSLAVRVVDAGSCNGCELEINALSNPYYNVEGSGVQFVASPRHADLLLVTGPVTLHMELALRRTWDAMPEPRLVVAAGDCACGRGVFDANYACRGGAARVLPVDVEVSGCPPSPHDLLAGMLLAVQRRG